MKSRDGKSQRREEQKKEDQKRESLRRKKVQACEKVGKPRNTAFFQWFVAPEGRKVGLLKRRVRSQLARWEMKNCTPLWREARFQVKMYKTHQRRTTFWSWDVEKVHAVVARSTCQSQNVQNTPGLGHFWKLRCRRSARRFGAKHISKSKCTKHTRSHFWKLRCRKVHGVVGRSTFQSQNVQNTPTSDHFWKLRCRKGARGCGAKHISKSKVSKTDGSGALLDVQMSFRVAGARDCAPWQKWAKREGFCGISKNDGKRGTFEDDMQRCISRGRRSTRDMFIRAVRMSGQLAPHQPLQRAYFSTLRSHKSLEKHSVSRLSYLFAHLDLLSSETFSFWIFLLLFSSPTLPISAFHLSILSGVCLLNFLR